MPRRLVNLALLVAVPVLVATGLLAWVAPRPIADALLVLHRVAGAGLVLVLAWKYGIARRSVRRRTRGRPGLGLAVSASASLALLLVLGLGLAWSIGLVSFDRPLPYSLLNVHVFVGVALVPLMVAHAARRWESRPAVADLGGRRVALRALAVGVGAVVATTALDRFGVARRATGSRAAAAFSGNDFPLTIWAFDAVPAIDLASWRMHVDGSVASPGALTYHELLSLSSTERDAVLDCTGGWWTEQRWRGVTLADLLDRQGVASATERVTVMSLTGHAWSFPMAEAERLLIATHVGGETLSPGHGYPARLIAPDHRGFQWIKWVSHVHVE
ncbi:MAG TPA: molybdopterin-dependent oxidoreductase [Candidatus Limnocylindria bacterium]|jgi:DMSO/TMAO reductase YedYZ molybdopterin-dependent catalytic subunit|nr:molybdopterin-dependent oxidoreductase [Candidatus Limnocylindria bacterium]